MLEEKYYASNSKAANKYSFPEENTVRFTVLES
jgi:hypothetical protein